MSANKSDFVVVANRLPVDRDGDGWTAAPGGLVTALKPVLEKNDGAWVGWPGTTDPVAAEDMPSPEETGITMFPVNLDTEDFTQFYEGFSNATLWPLYHDLIVQPKYDRQWWDRYFEVNKRFAEAATEAASDDAMVWVQDYQLHLVPGMMRQQSPNLRLGFFLHIPFPSPELFRQLPWRREVLAGTLGSDVVGFHTQDGARNFLDTLRALDYEVQTDDDEESAAFLRGARLPEDGFVVGRVLVDDAYIADKLGAGSNQGEQTPPPEHSHSSTEPSHTTGLPTPKDRREVLVGVFPISIDSAHVAETAHSPESVAHTNQLRAQLGSPRLLLAGVDRMDYTKGILHRLEAVEKLLDDGKLKANEVTMVQVATPSRERLGDYQQTREAVERVVSRINGNHGALGRPVVHYVHRSLPFEEIVALYSAADMMLVTPLKDGMNLVAKEYVACHSDGTGALILSEFTGAATQLTTAYLCNPHDPESVGRAILRADGEDATQRRERMSAMWENVRHHDVDRWARSFLGVLEGEGER
ncbi:alpha,alpha-trehalose-phosphate synthase (UDP-forming) [Corynebacterium heidelbergense]|uniref:alpha,alpha-trehalose-phosphate synthase (ADP-forming) n=1 Tax=Corynebacterium heidelbergense TaxID=2055947 RepID=A0A364V3Y2_9CORY|nr:trehalose-6-phosphate synthase [Corynebacterium heidelbergense]RAV31355.1 trehalose-6-phosphate synthase [Corynebacterium heidelbergense]